MLAMSHVRGNMDDREPGGVKTAPALNVVQQSMKYTLYEDPITHRFAIVRLPDEFGEGDRLPISPNARWFDSHTQAVASLSQLFDEDD
jgi:hypothetical protein